MSPKIILLNHYASLRAASKGSRQYAYKQAMIYLSFAPSKFFDDLAESLKVKLTDILELFKDWRIVKFFGKIGWSFKVLYEKIKDGLKVIKPFTDAVKDYVEKNKVVRWTTEHVKQFDEFLKKHPTGRKLAGVALAAMLLAIFFVMADSGDPTYDFDYSDVLSLLSGHFDLVSIFAGAEGVKLLTLFSVGAFAKITFPWPSLVSFAGAIIFTLANSFGHKLKKASRDDMIIDSAIFAYKIL